MNDMKKLLLFSMEKRMRNRTFWTVNALLFLLLFAAVFCDVILKQIEPAFFSKQVIYMAHDNDFYRYASEQTLLFHFLPMDKETDITPILDKRAWVLQQDTSYQLLSLHDVPILQQMQLQVLLEEYERFQAKNRGDIQVQAYLANTVLDVMVIVPVSDVNANPWGFFVITAIYFIALSYAGIAANDVIYEKSTRMMELILTSVSSTTHLVSKLLSGWLVLMIQLSLLGSAAVAACLLRYLYDRGEGLYFSLAHFGLIAPQSSETSFFSLAFFIEHHQVLLSIIIAVCFMMLGILFIQTILVILSSFISNMEEAGNIQSPFYLLFMGVYYLVIFLNTPHYMQEGIGKTLSMVPFFSMLFMPCRIFYYDVPTLEIVLSMLIAISALILLWFLGAPIYQIGVLDYSGKPFLRKRQNKRSILQD